MVQSTRGEPRFYTVLIHPVILQFHAYAALHFLRIFFASPLLAHGILVRVDPPHQGRLVELPIDDVPALQVSVFEHQGLPYNPNHLAQMEFVVRTHAQGEQVDKLLLVHVRGVGQQVADLFSQLRGQVHR